MKSPRESQHWLALVSTALLGLTPFDPFLAPPPSPLTCRGDGVVREFKAVPRPGHADARAALRVPLHPLLPRREQLELDHVRCFFCHAHARALLARVAGLAPMQRLPMQCLIPWGICSELPPSFVRIIPFVSSDPTQVGRAHGRTSRLSQSQSRRWDKFYRGMPHTFFFWSL